MPAANLGTRLKDANDTRTYSIDWSAWLAGLAGTDTIATSVWVAPSPITIVNQSNSTTKTNVRLSGGVSPSVYVIANTVTTVGGEIKQVVFRVSV
jgi:hypothetical protein